jgi:hypothetical protein
MDAAACSQPGPRSILRTMRASFLSALLVGALVVALPGLPALAQAKGDKKAKAGKKVDEPKRVAIAYLKALDGSGDDLAKEHLLGGATLTAEDFTIPNWSIDKREPAQVEVANIRDAVGMMRALEKAGRETLTGAVNLNGDDAMATLDQAAAEKLMAPTRERAKAFQKAHPVFAYVARVGKDVFWHPSNPWRAVLDEMGNSGKYRLELHVFRIKESEPGRKPRIWPLRVLRIQTKTYDSGWKILPASDWDPEF